MTQFICTTRVLAGLPAAQALRQMLPKRVLVVTDPYFQKNGMAEKIAAGSGAEKWEVFDRVTPDPTAVLAAEGTIVLKKFQPDVVVALGGGSAMDCAKAMLYFSGCNARLVAIPTTSGSGSEVTDFAILTHDGVKHPLVDSSLRPWAAILDEEVLGQLPPGLIADGGFDVLSHALEALVATGASPITDALARDAFCAAFSALPASFSGDKSVRPRIHMAATMAGMAFTQAGLGVCHALSHALGGLYHLPHGRLNAILLPAVIRCNSAGSGGKYAQLARSAGLGGGAEIIALRNLKNALIRLRRQLEMPRNLAEAGVSPRQLQQDMEKIVAAALADPCCKTNPVPVTEEMLLDILQEVAGFE